MATSPADKAALHAAAQKFEAMMVRQMLAEARKTDFGDTLMSNEGTKTFREMQDSRFADAAAKTGSLGFAKMIEAQLSRQSQTASGEGR
jgi:flagellar protein FlgJ